MVVSLVVGLSLMFVSKSSSNYNSNTMQMKGANEKNDFSGNDKTMHASSIMIELDSVKSIDFYHCSGEGPDIDQHIVLLHGAAFTKENWKASGILEMFCQSPRVSVTALDLPVTALYSQFRTILDDLKKRGIIQLPLAGIVTPSASGFTIINGIFDTDDISVVDDLKTQVAHVWIPVASGGILKYTENDIRQTLLNWKILAIYGDQDDSPGRRSSNLLKRAIPSTRVVELPGRHPVYLDSPRQFVNTILQFLSEKS
jgi:pimeloyl-ACP methyl ester carboxylesterase